MFTPTRSAALNRLEAFLPNAGRTYAIRRNHVDITGTSALSPYIRHRIITEAEVLRAVLDRHDAAEAGKFVQEVFWRTYWKGWLELRPTVWNDYRTELQAALKRFETESGLRQQWEAACKGGTGIDCFDHWARELARTGYLHNHARMWFASIWIFTLRLPWVLGADFFLRHLLDGDPASNTLSWRWVGGLQTQGKTYLATAENIARYTDGRFQPKGLATDAAPLDGPAPPPPGPAPQSDRIDLGRRTGLLLTEEDLSLDWLLDQVTPICTALVQTTDHRSPLETASRVTDFVAGAFDDCTARFGDRLGPVARLTADAVARWAADNALDQIVTSYIPTGPTRDALSGIDIKQLVRPYDAAAWPLATHGFFRFRDNIPPLVAAVTV